MNIVAHRPPAALAGGPSTLVLAGWLLRLSVFVFCAGIAVTVFTRLGTGIGTYFFLEHSVPHPTVGYYERLTAGALLLLAFAALIRPHWAFLLPIALLVFLEAWARRFNGGTPFFEWAIYAYALRIVTPLALAALFSPMLHRMAGDRGALHATGWILRIGLATVFFIHGVEAFLGHPRFIDFIIGSSWNLAGYEMTERSAVVLLKIIGTVDIAVALAVLVKPAAPILYWMAFWGLITALSRVTTFGLGMHYEVLVRFSHFLAPIALLLILAHLARTQVAGARQSGPGLEASENISTAPFTVAEEKAG